MPVGVDACEEAVVLCFGFDMLADQDSALLQILSSQSVCNALSFPFNLNELAFHFSLITQ